MADNGAIYKNGLINMNLASKLYGPSSVFWQLDPKLCNVKRKSCLLVQYKVQVMMSPTGDEAKVTYLSFSFEMIALNMKLQHILSYWCQI